MAKYSKAASATIEKLKEQLKDAKKAATAAKKSVKSSVSEAKTATKKKYAKKKKAQQVFSAGDWTGAAPKKLTIYKVRLMLDEQQIGIFGPYATIRAASADAKNILRMHVGPGYKIEEIGVDEPLLRSDGKVKVYFHPSIYSAQGTDKGVLTAQVIEQGGEAKRKSTFVKKYNPARTVAGMASQSRVSWSRMTRAQIEALMVEAGQHGDHELVKRARAALARRRR